MVVTREGNLTDGVRMPTVSAPRESIRSLDPTDERILRLLVRDARASYTDLGERVGLSANAVAQRMRRMERSGVIRGYTALLEPRETRPTPWWRSCW